jgi:hypothetical protein
MLHLYFCPTRSYRLHRWLSTRLLILHREWHNYGAAKRAVYHVPVKDAFARCGWLSYHVFMSTPSHATSGRYFALPAHCASVPHLSGRVQGGVGAGGGAPAGKVETTRLVDTLVHLLQS